MEGKTLANNLRNWEGGSKNEKLLFQIPTAAPALTDTQLSYFSSPTNSSRCFGGHHISTIFCSLVGVVQQILAQDFVAKVATGQWHAQLQLTRGGRLAPRSRPRTPKRLPQRWNAAAAVPHASWNVARAERNLARNSLSVYFVSTYHQHR